MKSWKHPLRAMSLVLRVVLLALLPAQAWGDVILHPGKLNGTAGLSGWTVNSSSLTLSGNENGFSASTSWTGNTFSLTTEGDQLYESLSLTHYFATGSLSIYSSASYYIPVGEALQVDLTRPNGVIVHQVLVRGGTPVHASLAASSSNTLLRESYGSYMSGDPGGAMHMPMIASEGVRLTGNVEVSVEDGLGNSLCRIWLSLTPQQISLTEGLEVRVVHEVIVPSNACTSGVEGTVTLQGVPEGIDFSSAWVNASSQSQYRETWISRNNPAYRLEGLLAGNYSMRSQLNFTPPAGSTGRPSGSLYLPRQNPSSVEVQTGQMAQWDFNYEGGLAKGAFVTTNFFAQRLQSGSVSFSGHNDWSQPGGGPTAGGYAQFSPQSVYDRTFLAVLTPGEWNAPTAYFWYQDATRDPQSYSLSYTAHGLGPFSLTARQSTELQLVPVPNNQVLVYFDVVEEPGTPQVLLSSPSLYAYRYSSVDNDSSNVSISKRATDRMRIPVVFVGPRGRYELQAYAYVAGSRVRFSASVLEVGTAVATLAGSQVEVGLQNGQGERLPVEVRFASVDVEGATTGSLTDMGPGAPEGYELFDVTPGTRYIFLDTTAEFTGAVEVAVEYEPAALGLTPEQEAQLVLQQFVCESEENCRWVLLARPEAIGALGFGGAETREHVVRGLTAHLGTLALTLLKERPVPPSSLCVGTPESPVELPTAVRTCGVAVSESNRLAGSCAAGSRGLVSCTFNGASPLILAPGVHAIQVMATDLAGTQAACWSYVEVRDTAAPQLTCSPPQTAECTGELTAVSVHAACTDNCDGTCSSVCSARAFRVGTSQVSCSARDSAGNTSSCDTSVTIIDTSPPELRVSAAPTYLWPPNHKLRPITLATKSADRCDPHPVVQCSAVSSEPDDGRGDGSTGEDIVWKDGQLWLRAERSGTNAGRVYTVTCVAHDAAGNPTTSSATIEVPLRAP